MQIGSILVATFVGALFFVSHGATQTPASAKPGPDDKAKKEAEAKAAKAVRATKDAYTAKVGWMQKVQVDTAAARVIWINTDSDLQLEPSESGQWAMVAAQKPGTYTIAAYGATLVNGSAVPSDPAYIKITFEASEPVKSPNVEKSTKAETAPGSAEKAPPKQKPAHAADTPASEIAKAAKAFGGLIQDAHANDKATGKAGNLAHLADIYDAAAYWARNDPNLATWGDLLSKLAERQASVHGFNGTAPGVIGALQQRLRTELTDKSAASSTTTQWNREAASGILSAIGAALRNQAGQ